MNVKQCPKIIVKSPPRLMNKAGKERRSAAKTLLL